MTVDPAEVLRGLGEHRSVRDHYRLLLGSARANALADAEGAEGVIFAIESLGRFLLGSDKPLEATAPKLADWLEARLGEPRRKELDKKMWLLRRGRNDRMHKGFAARNLTADAVRVAVMLEDAMKVDWEAYEAQDVMVPSPLQARPWHTFGMVRDALIENAYTHLPIYTRGAWHVVSERAVAAVATRARKGNLDLRSVRIDQAPKGDPAFGVILDHLLRAVPTVPPTAKAIDLELDEGCVLVVRSERQGEPAELVGIITPSDVA